MTPGRRSYVIKGDLAPSLRGTRPARCCIHFVGRDTDGAALVSAAADDEAALGDTDGAGTRIFTRVRCRCWEDTTALYIHSFLNRVQSGNSLILLNRVIQFTIPDNKDIQ